MFLFYFFLFLKCELYYIFNFTVGWAWDKLYKTSFVKTNKLYFQNLRSSNDVLFVYLSLVKANRIIIINEALISHRQNTQTSLSETRMKSPSCFINALLEIQKELLQMGIYEEVKQSYLNFVLVFSLWHFRTLPIESEKKIYSKLYRMYKKLGLYDYPEDYFYKLEYCDYSINNFHNLMVIKNNALFNEDKLLKNLKFTR